MTNSNQCFLNPYRISRSIDTLEQKCLNPYVSRVILSGLNPLNNDRVLKILQ